MPPALTAADGRAELPPDPVPGAVYTPPFLADWVADRLLRSLPADATTIADLACGEGALLSAVGTKSPRELELVGADVDRAALRKAGKALPEARLKHLDAIDASLAGWDKPASRLRVRRIEGVILNPPWGVELSTDRAEMRRAGFELARGQCDSADLFLELTVKLLAEGGAAALILPDSLFFPDHAPVRRFLLENCTLDLIARLGEGFFPGVFRGTAVVVLRRGKAAKGHAVECLRLSPAQRKQVLSGEVGLDRIAAESAHPVPQSRFDRSDGADFAIDVRQADLRHVQAVYRQTAAWTRTLTGGRGVELSKHGEVVVCVTCGRRRPRPRKAVSVHCECGDEIDPTRAHREKIVREIQTDRPGLWVPLIAGDDVRRYRCSPRREIRTGIDGINYKLKMDLNRPRLLVRKTGIGLKAAIYSGPALTTQTVFHYQGTKDSPDFLLPYALGVICSRAMLAVHLKRTGENEWRSHPYVTQRLLADLPIPHPSPDSQQWRQARAIAELASRQRGDEPSAERDLEIERLVAGLYGLDSSDLLWVDRVLNEAQGMEGIASLRLPAELRLDPILVD